MSGEDIAKKYYRRYINLVRDQDAELAKILADAARQAEREILRSIGDPRVGARVRRIQLSKSLLAIRRAQASLWKRVSDSIKKGIARAEQLSAEADVEIARFLSRVMREEGIRNAHELADIFEAAAERGVKNVRSRLNNEQPLSKLVYKNRALATKKVAREVNRGIVLNKSSDEIAHNVRGMIRPDTPGGVSYAAKRLARTEINNAYQETTKESYKDDPWVTGVKWNLSLSHRKKDRCDVLATADPYGLGRGVYRKTNVPDRPHPNDMCFITPYMMSAEQATDAFFNGAFDDWARKNGLEPIKPTPKESDPEIREGVNKVVERAKKNEPAITKRVQRVADEVDGKLGGLEFRLKAKEGKVIEAKKRLRQKVVDKVWAGATVQEAVGKIGDAVRYTVLFEPDDYIAGAKRTLAAMRRDFIQVGETENSWGGSTYQGINTNFKHKGQVFEFQIHTPETFETKNGEGHRLYEITRDNDRPEGERAKARKDMLRLWRPIRQRRPKGAERIR